MEVWEARELLGIPPDADFDEARAALTRTRRAGPADSADARSTDEAARIVQNDIDENGPPVAPRPVDWPPPKGVDLPSMPVPRSARARTSRSATRTPTRHRKPRRVDWLSSVPAAVGLWCGLALIVIGMVACSVAFSWLLWLWALIPIGFVALAILGAALTDSKSRTGLLFVAVGFIPAAVLGGAIQAAVLHDRGKIVLATIAKVSEYSFRTGTTFQYSLVAPDGTPLPGGTYDVDGEATPYQVGDRVTVRYDPKGVVPPEPPDSGPPPVATFVGVGITTAAMFGCVISWTRRTQRRSRVYQRGAKTA